MNERDALQHAITTEMNAADKWYQAKLETLDDELKVFYTEQRDSCRQTADILRGLLDRQAAMDRLKEMGRYPLYWNGERWVVRLDDTHFILGKTPEAAINAAYAAWKAGGND